MEGKKVVKFNSFKQHDQKNIFDTREGQHYYYYAKKKNQTANSTVNQPHQPTNSMTKFQLCTSSMVEFAHKGTSLLLVQTQQGNGFFSHKSTIS